MCNRVVQERGRAIRNRPLRGQSPPSRAKGLAAGSAAGAGMLASSIVLAGSGEAKAPLHQRPEPISNPRKHSTSCEQPSPLALLAYLAVYRSLAQPVHIASMVAKIPRLRLGMTRALVVGRWSSSVVRRPSLPPIHAPYRIVYHLGL